MFCSECENLMIITDNIVKKNEDIDINSSDYEDELVSNDNKQENVDVKTQNAYYYCNNCGNYENVLSGTIIYNEKTYQFGNEIITGNYLNFKHDNTLPFTKKYNCVNDDCPTHKNPEMKKAIFYRYEMNNYKLKYICTVCNYHWNF